MTIDPPKTVCWVGQILIQSSKPDEPVPDFMEMWKDHLPEYWRNIPSLKLLEVGARTNFI